MRRFITLFTILCPTIVTMLFIYLIFGKMVFDFIPAYVNDEINYWHQISTFSQVGFSGGYYTTDEQPASAQFTHFGSHGPTFPVLYGALGYVFGWHSYSGLIFNLVLITLALAWFAYITQPSQEQNITLLFFIGSFWALLVFIPTNMQESLHHAIGILLAGGFYILLNQQKYATYLYKLLFFIFILVASFARLTWGFLLFPFFLLCFKNTTKLVIFMSIASTILIMAIMAWQYRYLNAPYPLLFFYLKIGDWFPPLPIAVVANIIRNLRWFHVGHGIEILHRYQYVLVVMGLGWFIGSTLFGYFKQKIDFKHLFDEINNVELLAFYNVAIMLIFQITLYRFAGDRDYRTLAPHLLLTLLLLIAFNRRKYIIRLFILSNLIFIGVFINNYRGMRTSNFIYDQESINRFEKVAQKFIAYEQNENSWCNTILTTHYPFHFYQTVALPAGIGISNFFIPENVDFPIKSHFVLFDVTLYNQADWDYKVPIHMENTHDNIYTVQWGEHGTMNLEYLTDTPIGNLYRNIDADCQAYLLVPSFFAICP